MAILLALVSALAYGTSDFLGGVASTEMDAAQVSVGTQGIGTLAAVGLVLLIPGRGLTMTALGWGALSGVGSTIGTLALYRGLAAGPMSVVATLSGVLNVVIPAVVGLALGDHLTPAAAAGIGLTVPAIGLVSMRAARRGDGDGDVREAVICGALAGVGFALLFIALSRAGAHAGAWPLLPGQAVSLVGVTAVAARRGRLPRLDRRTGVAVCTCGLLSVTATLFYLLATHRGELAIVAALGALYPATTILLARVVLGERLGRRQVAGLCAAAVGVVLISLG